MPSTSSRAAFPPPIAAPLPGLCWSNFRLPCRVRSLVGVPSILRSAPPSDLLEVFRELVLSGVFEASDGFHERRFDLETPGRILRREEAEAEKEVKLGARGARGCTSGFVWTSGCVWAIGYAVCARVCV